MSPVGELRRAFQCCAAARTGVCEECGRELVTVSRTALALLYQCAKSYETRVPEGIGGEWAFVFRDLFDK